MIMQDDNEITLEDAEALAQEAEEAEAAGFEAGFSGEEMIAATEEGVDLGESEEEEDEEAVAADADELVEYEEEHEEEHEADPYADRFSSYDSQIRTLNGRFGTLNRDIAEIKAAVARGAQAATSDVGREGGDAPSPGEIKAARQDSEKWDALREDYPDWAEAFDERMEMQAAHLMRQVEGRVQAGPSEAQIQEYIQRAIENDLAARAEEAEAKALEEAYPDYRGITSSDNFWEWALKDGPSRDDYTLLNQLRNEGQTDEANALEHSMVVNHPRWWADRGSLIGSTKSEDAIALLNAYTGKSDDPGPGESPSAQRRRTRNARLQADVTPTRGRGASPAHRSADEEVNSAFEQGFNNG